MEDSKIIDLYFERSEDAIKETDINTENTAERLPIIFYIPMRIRRNV